MHFPLREDQLDVVAFLKPSLKKLQKPPLLCFGWIVRDEEIIAIAKKKNIGPITLEDYLFPGEPGYPEGQETDEYGGTTVTTTEYHPMYTGDRLFVGVTSAGRTVGYAKAKRTQSASEKMRGN